MTALKPRLAGLIEALSSGLIERLTPVRLALLAALTGEHLLLIGPPGTAKSELARRLHCAFSDAVYFERLLTRFSVPEELFGPLSIAALEQDRYERQTEGYLPSASIAFIDEVFKANSSILNALLTLLNEREFDNGAQRVPTPLISVIGASNEVPDDEIVAAFYDRFLLRYPIAPVSREAFNDLIALPDEKNDAVAAELRLSHDELKQIAQRADAVTLPPEVLELLTALRDFVAQQNIYVSDRRWRKIVRLLKTAALTNGRDTVSIWDGWLLQFCAMQRPEQCALIADWYAARLGVHQALNPERFGRVVQAFEAQLELEQNANDVNYGSDGKMAALAELSDAKGGEGAVRMTAFMRKRRYPPSHIAARVAQTQALVDEINTYLLKLDATLAELNQAVSDHLWIAPEFAVTASNSLRQTRDNVGGLRLRLVVMRDGFADLPQLELTENMPDRVPEPIAVA